MHAVRQFSLTTFPVQYWKGDWASFSPYVQLFQLCGICVSNSNELLTSRLNTGRFSFLPHAQVPYIKMHWRLLCIFFIKNVFCMLFIKELSLCKSSHRQRHGTLQTPSAEVDVVMFPPGNMPKKGSGLGCSGVKWDCSYTWLCCEHVAIISSLFFFVPYEIKKGAVREIYLRIRILASLICCLTNRNYWSVR